MATTELSGLRAALADATERLAAAGVDSPRGDAEQLAAHVLGVRRSQLALVESLPPGALTAFAALVERRAAREPLQHLVRRVGFRWIEVAVGPGVYVPRPETELVAGAAVDAARRQAAPVVVDLCAGSGVIALSVAHEVPDAAVHAVELDPAALEWLRRNTSGTRVTVHEGDAASALPELDGRVDVVVSNPPYVPESALAATQPEVRGHDPHRALVGGADGLDVVRAVARAAERLLRPGGTFVTEHDDTHGDSVPALLRAAGAWTDVLGHTDLTGRPRFTTATRT